MGPVEYPHGIGTMPVVEALAPQGPIAHGTDLGREGHSPPMRLHPGQAPKLLGLGQPTEVGQRGGPHAPLASRLPLPLQPPHRQRLHLRPFAVHQRHHRAIHAHLVPARGHGGAPARCALTPPPPPLPPLLGPPRPLPSGGAPSPVPPSPPPARPVRQPQAFAAPLPPSRLPRHPCAAAP